jgi:uncharacterized protein YdiU (UPF0061 family)
MTSKFLSQFSDLGPGFSSPATPRRTTSPQLVAWNQELADELGLSDLSEETRTEWFSGQSLPPQTKPVAAAYAGHQFAHFVSSLGDGRAILLGEVKSRSGQVLDIQLKGAGPTPYSRGGDGLAAVGPVIREFLVSEYMHALGVPTTRSLAACMTGDWVMRQAPHPGAVLTRVATSHVRVGSFEFHRNQENLPALKSLLGYCLNRHYPELIESKRPAFEFLKKVRSKLSDLVSHWMGLGFVHGVLNTDNTSVAGLTLDYGPCAFLDEYNPDKVFSSIDRQGRYRFSQQASILQWNLARLAECLLPFELGGKDTLEQSTLDEYSEVIKNFTQDADAKIQRRYLRKLGLDFNQSTSNEGSKILGLWLNLLHDHALDYTQAWTALKDLNAGGNNHHDFFPKDSENFKSFVSLWRPSAPNVDLLNENPVYIPRNHILEQAISSAEAGDFALFNKLRECFKQPTVRDQQFAELERAPTKDELVLHTFCGT